MALVGDDDAARIHVFGPHAEVAEGQGDDVARQPLSVTRDGVDGSRRQFAQHGQTLHQFGEFLKMRVERPVELGAVVERHHLAGFARMKVPQVVELRNVLFAFALDGGFRDGQQLVGGLAHGRDHHHRAASLALPHDPRNAVDGGCRLHRRAAELHHDHRSSIPSECISSALSTAAPAAPRTVLWPRQTNL